MNRPRSDPPARDAARSSPPVGARGVGSERWGSARRGCSRRPGPGTAGRAGVGGEPLPGALPGLGRKLKGSSGQLPSETRNGSSRAHLCLSLSCFCSLWELRRRAPLAARSWALPRARSQQFGMALPGAPGAAAELLSRRSRSHRTTAGGGGVTGRDLERAPASPSARSSLPASLSQNFVSGAVTLLSAFPTVRTGGEPLCPARRSAAPPGAPAALRLAMASSRAGVPGSRRSAPRPGSRGRAALGEREIFPWGSGVNSRT